VVDLVSRGDEGQRADGHFLFAGDAPPRPGILPQRAKHGARVRTERAFFRSLREDAWPRRGVAAKRK